MSRKPGSCRQGEEAVPRYAGFASAQWRTLKLRVVLCAIWVTESARADEAPVATIAVSSATSGSSLSGNLVEGMAAGPRTSSVQSGGRDLVGTVALGDGGRLDLDHDLRLEEPGDAEERAHGLAAGLGPERHQLPGRAHEAIDVGRIEVQADDVGRLHAGRLQHLDEVRPGLARLRYDVARVQRRPLRVVRGLAGHVQDPLTTLHLDRLVDVKRVEPRLRIDRTDFHR